MTHPLIETDTSLEAVPVHAIGPEGLDDLLAELPGPAAHFAKAQGFKAKKGETVLLPDAQGGLAQVLFGLGDKMQRDPLLAGLLPGRLPAGLYRLNGAGRLDVLAWLMGAYRFTRYRSGKSGNDGTENGADDGARARLLAPEGVDVAGVAQIARALALGRDLINTPANDCGPAEIAQAVERLAQRHNASCQIIEGDALVAENLPMIHAVGRASPRAPRLIDLRWGRADAPRVTLVGKGVAFDTGGLNIKPDNAMSLMKKDMGGAAAAIAAAAMVMASGLDLRLRLLVPAVENAISGNAFRPGDVLPSRKGLSVEIGNTDAEGRLILADALALADEEAPELLIDFATLTGSARVALGPDLPPFMTDDEALAADLARIGMAEADPVWRLPLWQPYDDLLRSSVADLNHISGNSFAGAIIAGLFLRRFVEKAESYLHFDIYGWVPNAKPGRPKGGEAQAARLVHALLTERYPARAGGSGA
ncbi:MAG: leucyl aminopeptidase [Saliniramus fredricksonii]|uniref:Leucyl aminopeptidase n=1 Tax=Saliniramus fredricksonii TaxID=1653334 RepID=A0A0P7X579_9HYPH|nr:leucyl aminopeptidase family protein [Saliniramus fredricksonii]KPQ10069.1 MAG: leucyl aminopeptidase [Saliniramus fredricksonii]SCC80572.1 leucyl aminopeptidase [Saliniramus fredricksonii]